MSKFLITSALSLLLAAGGAAAQSSGTASGAEGTSNAAGATGESGAMGRTDRPMTGGSGATTPQRPVDNGTTGSTTRPDRPQDNCAMNGQESPAGQTAEQGQAYQSCGK